MDSDKKQDIHFENFLKAIRGPQKVDVVNTEVFNSIPTHPKGIISLKRGLSNIKHLNANLDGTFYGGGTWGSGLYFAT